MTNTPQRYVTCRNSQNFCMKIFNFFSSSTCNVIKPSRMHLTLMAELLHFNMERNMTQDEKYMKEALKQAKKAYDLGEVPIGCVIVYQEKIIGRGYNRRNTDSYCP